MNKEKDFFKTCFDTIAGLEVKNESQAIAKEVVLSEIERLQQENKKLNGAIQTYDILLKANVEENKQLKEEKRKVRDYINKHCVNEKISKEVGYKCYTMADTNELEKIMKILGDKE